MNELPFKKKISIDNPSKEIKYKHVTYSTGFAIKVTPEDRGHEVLHYLITGGLLGGKSLDGVTWEEVDAPDSTKALTRSMKGY